jgi:osmotically-inducible protein OsmY
MTTRELIALGACGSLLAALAGCADYAAYRKCGSACPGDEQIGAGVSARLAEHRELAAPNQVYVRTLDRVVYLNGQVATGLQREIAESVARGAPGVQRVVDNISITYEGH